MLGAIKRVDRVLERVFSIINTVFEAISIIGMVGIMIALASQTILKWFYVSILWSDEIVSVMNIWLVFLAATVVERENKHVQVTVITEKFPVTVQKVLDILIGALCIWAIFVVFRGGLEYIARTANIKTNILRLPSVALYTAPVIALAVMGLMRIWRMVKLIASFFAPELAPNYRKGGVEA